MKAWAMLAVCVLVMAGWGASAMANPANLADPADQSHSIYPAGQPNPANPPSPPDRAGQDNGEEPTGSRPTTNLRLAAPLVPQAVPLLAAGESALFQKAGIGASFSLWRSPEQLRALVANGQVDAVVAALPTAAVLAQRGVPCVVLAAYAAPLWLVGPPDLAREGEPPLDMLRRLLNREILLPFGPGNMPELALRVLAAQSSLDCPLRHCGSALEAVNLLRLGQGGPAAVAFSLGAFKRAGCCAGYPGHALVRGGVGHDHPDCGAYQRPHHLYGASGRAGRG